MIESLIAAAAGLLIGLAGSVHCLAMCGPLASGLAFGFSPQRRQGTACIKTLAWIGTGKVALYTVLGAAMGTLGDQLLDPQWFGLILMINGMLLLLMGLYGIGLKGPNQAIERLFAPISAPLTQVSRRLLPIDSNAKALAWGGLWGLLPCGLVYTALLWSLTLSNAAYGALGMLMFGLGTLPAALGAGYLGLKLASWLKSGRLGRISGGLLILIAMTSIALGFAQI